MISPMTLLGKYDEIMGDEITVMLMHKWLKNCNGIVVINRCLSNRKGLSHVIRQTPNLSLV